MSVRHERAADRAQSSGAPERILVAATEQFAAKGLAGARVDEIARAARVNKQLVYYYYGGKLELYNQVLGQMVEESRHKIEAEATCKTLAEKMEFLTRAGTFPNSLRWQRLLGWEALETDPGEGGIVREEDRRGAWERHVASVREAQASGELDEFVLALTRWIATHRSDDAEQLLVDAGVLKPGDTYGITCGEPMGYPGGTNMLKVVRVG